MLGPCTVYDKTDNKANFDWGAKQSLGNEWKTAASPVVTHR